MFLCFKKGDVYVIYVLKRGCLCFYVLKKGMFTGMLFIF